MLEALTIEQLNQLLTLCKARLRGHPEPPNTLPRPIVFEVWRMARDKINQLITKLRHSILDRSLDNVYYRPTYFYPQSPGAA